MIMKQRIYKAPSILKTVDVLLEDNLLASVVTPKTKIETAGQKVEDHSFSDSGFNSKWE